MGIRINGDKIPAIFYGNIPVISIYLNKQLIWSKEEIIDEILSCYSNGYWADEYPWIDETPWI